MLKILCLFQQPFSGPAQLHALKNRQFDAWYDESLNAPDTLRWALYRHMDSLAMSYAPLIPLYYDQLLHFTQNNISGFGSNPMNIIELKRVELK